MEWKTVTINDRYEVSDAGEVRNAFTGHVLAKQIDKYGYEKVWLSYGKRLSAKPIFVHRLVAMAFLPNPNDCAEVNHKNHVRTDNHLDNLEWCTNKQNVQDAKGHKVLAVKNGDVVGKYPSIKSAAEATGLSDTMIGYCLRGRYGSARGYSFCYAK